MVKGNLFFLFLYINQWFIVNKHAKPTQLKFMKSIVTVLLSLGFIFLFNTSFGNIKNVDTTFDSEMQTMTFNTDGLYFAEFYDYIYRGHFENVEIKREDTEFLMIFEQYLRAYGRQCDAYLPSDKVKIMNEVCARKEKSYNVYGDLLSSVCVEYTWVPSGLYAKPDLYNAKMEVDRIQRSKGLQTVMSMILDPNAMGNSVDMIHKANGLKNDMARIFTLNPGNSSGLKRFEVNLKLYALHKPAIRMQGSSKYAVMKKTGGPEGAQDFTSLIDDLVANQAQTWSFNKYVPGSISGVRIESKDQQDRPTTVRANYSYKGFGNSSNGWVQITFEKGLPKCMYFFDFPTNCKTPNSSIVASYAQGNYGEN